MKRLIIAFIAFAVVCLTSCSKDDSIDYTMPENLSGTSWKYTVDEAELEDMEYALLIFTSTSVVEGWTREIDEEELKDFTGTYSISDNTITIDDDDDYSYIGIITGENLDLIIGELTFKFVLQ